MVASAAPTPDHEPWCYRRHAGDCVDGRDPEMDYEMRDRMLAIASSNLATRAARPPSDCACGWPGCSGQCHTGASCPCHPMTPYTEAEDAALDAIEGTHAAHDDEPDPECADCQERAAELWDRMAGSY